MLIFPYLVSLIIRATANTTSVLSPRGFALPNAVSDSLISSFEPDRTPHEIPKNQTAAGSSRENSLKLAESSEASPGALIAKRKAKSYTFGGVRGIFRIPSFGKNTGSTDSPSSISGAELAAKRSKKSKKSVAARKTKPRGDREGKEDRARGDRADTGLDGIADGFRPSEASLGGPLQSSDAAADSGRIAGLGLETEALIESLRGRLQSIRPLLSSTGGESGVEVRSQHLLASSAGQHRKGLSQKVVSPVFSTVGVVALVVFVLLSISVAGYTTKIFLNELNKAISNGYTEFIEKQAAVRKISPQQLKRYRSTVWNRSSEPSEADEKKPWSFVEDFSGSRIYFFNKEVAPETFVCNHSFSRLPSLEPDVPGIYFEIEVEYLHDQAAIVIGISDLLDLLEIRKGRFPGNTLRSVGFNIKTGEVFMGNTIAHKFDIAETIKATIDAETSRLDDPAGNFYGIGFIFDLGVFFFTFNGRILNSLSYQALGEANTKLYLLKKHEMVEQSESIRKAGDIMKFINHLDLKKSYRDEIKRIPQFQSINEELHPVIYLAGAAKFFVNVGAAPFQVKDAAAQTGLLGSP